MKQYDIHEDAGDVNTLGRKLGQLKEMTAGVDHLRQGIELLESCNNWPMHIGPNLGRIILHLRLIVDDTMHEACDCVGEDTLGDILTASKHHVTELFMKTPAYSKDNRDPSPWLCPSGECGVRIMERPQYDLGKMPA